jgi:hypothetical protein
LAALWIRQVLGRTVPLEQIKLKSLRTRLGGGSETVEAVKGFGATRLVVPRILLVLALDLAENKVGLDEAVSVLARIQHSDSLQQVCLHLTASIACSPLASIDAFLQA